jgi:hypothetical protein
MKTAHSGEEGKQESGCIKFLQYKSPPSSVSLHSWLNILNFPSAYHENTIKQRHRKKHTSGNQENIIR